MYYSIHSFSCSNTGEVKQNLSFMSNKRRITSSLKCQICDWSELIVDVATNKQTKNMKKRRFVSDALVLVRVLRCGV